MLRTPLAADRKVHVWFIFSSDEDGMDFPPTARGADLLGLPKFPGGLRRADERHQGVPPRDTL